MAKSRRRYITVENSFFERQPRIARHPTGDRNEDEKPRNLGVQSPPPPSPLDSLVPLWCTRPTGYISQFAWANLSRNSYPSFLPRNVSFSPSVVLKPNIRVFFSFVRSHAASLPSPITFGLIQAANNFLFHLSPILQFPILLMKLFKVMHLRTLARQFLSVFCFIYIHWKVSECRSDLASN